MHDAWLLLDYIVRLLSVLIFLNLVPTHDPWSSVNSYRVSFNDNEALQSPEEHPDEQHSRVVVVGSNIEGNSARLDIGEGDREGESGEGAVGGGEGRDGGGGEGGAGRGGGDRGEDRGDVESGGEDRNWRLNISKLAKMFIMVAIQTTAACIGFHCSDQHPHHFLNKIFLDSILLDDLVGFLCCIIAIFLIHKKPHIAEILGGIGFIVVVFGFVLLTTLFFVKSHVC